MSPLVNAIAEWFTAVWSAWNRFWFKPDQPHTLALVRICAGAMLLYTHLVWAINQQMFLGRESWINGPTAALMNTTVDGRNYAWSYLYYVDSPFLLGVLNLAAVVVMFMLMIGFYTRVVSVLAFIITLSYCHRLTGSLFGLDQVNAMFATYLMIGPSGAVYSVDRWLAERRGTATPVVPSTMTNIAIRLLQLHMCVIYLYGGIGKARGELWWDGSACWYAIANLEYQSHDLTWLVRYPWFIALLTHITLFWEVFYCFLVWPKLTRPICLTLAVGVHLGIALFLGMPTFGLAMIIGNMAFVYPELIAAVVGLKWLRRSAEAKPADVPVVRGTTTRANMRNQLA
ncbi:HTTM domain-containing protein [Anatilimnocola sp. NA78]|uniref:HTTM domain-containing protein n=1 Tax=Anatilimnocola sp. NA78 TaxID=3415683 RepID=UPI003CE48EB0